MQEQMMLLNMTRRLAKTVGIARLKILLISTIFRIILSTIAY
jgi:hypothetical protein